MEKSSAPLPPQHPASFNSEPVTPPPAAPAAPAYDEREAAINLDVDPEGEVTHGTAHHDGVPPVFAPSNYGSGASPHPATVSQESQHAPRSGLSATSHPNEPTVVVGHPFYVPSPSNRQSSTPHQYPPGLVQPTVPMGLVADGEPTGPRPPRPRLVGTFKWPTHDWEPPAGPMMWVSSLVECCENGGNCVDTVACTPCVIAHQFESVAGYRNQDLAPAWCFLTACLPCVIPCTAMMIRKEVVVRYNLAESESTTVLSAIFCPLCSLCQTHRELIGRGVWPGGVCCEATPDPLRWSQTTYWPASHPKFDLMFS